MAPDMCVDSGFRIVELADDFVLLSIGAISSHVIDRVGVTKLPLNIVLGFADGAERPPV